jgi:hypothetical protein
MDTEEYEKLRSNTEKYYASILPVYSPALKSKIIFSAPAFNHIIYKNPRNERERKTQMLRFKLLPLAIKLIGFTNTFQEYEETIQSFRIQKEKERIFVSKPVIYWGLIAIIDGRKIKVILRKVGNGEIHFWSVIPAWITNKTRDGKFFKTMKGDPNED